MITLGTFTCTPPSVNAVKTAGITCTANNPENYEWLGTVADWFIFAAAVAAAIFARLAWKTAKQQLAHMQESYLDDQRAAALGNFLEAFSNHCTYMPPATGEEEKEMLRPVAIAYKRWTLTYALLSKKRETLNLFLDYKELHKYELGFQEELIELGHLDELPEDGQEMQTLRMETLDLCRRVQRDVEQTCLELHRREITEERAQEVFEELSIKVKNQVQRLETFQLNRPL